MQLTLEFFRSQQADDPFAFRVGLQEYVRHTEGGGAQTASLNWDEALLADLAAVAVPGSDPAIAQRLGDRLQRFIAPTNWAAEIVEIAAAVERGEAVSITLRLGAAELFALPWELLTLKGSGQRLGELPGVLLRYEWPETQSAAEQPAPRPEGGRILLAWSAAAGAVPAAEHQAALLAASPEGCPVFDAGRDMLPNVSADSLRERLASADAKVAVLHILCHGVVRGATAGLAWDGPEGCEIIDATRLRQLLLPHAGALRLVVLSACHSGASGQLGNHLGSIAQTLHRAGILAVVASRFPLSVAGSVVLTEALYAALVGVPASLESAMRAARTRLLQGAGLDWAGLQLYARAADGDDSRPLVFRPYRGLLAFGPDDRRFFVGREREVATILGNLEARARAGRPRFLVVAGASGTGKSSLVLASAVPQLRSRATAGLGVVVVRPAADGLAKLEQALGHRPAGKSPFLIVVDQFEEVFTSLAPAPRASLVRRLWSLASAADSAVSVIITLRIDFIGRCGELLLDDSGLHLDRVAYDSEHSVFVAQLGGQELRAAIERPAQLAGLQLQAGLCERMLADVGDQPGALPLLEYTLDQLWQRRRDRQLTQEAYLELGGASGALEQQAEKLLAALSEPERKAARLLMVALVEVRDDALNDTRRRGRVSELRPRDGDRAAVFDRVLEQLVSARLLVLAQDGNTSTVEVAHEALIRHWQTLRQWLKADREKLLALAKLRAWTAEWAQFKSALLQSDQLGYAREVERNYPDELDDKMRQLIAASEDAIKRRVRTARVLQGMAVGTALVVAIVITISAQITRKQAMAVRTASALAAKRAEELQAASQQAADRAREARAAALVATVGAVIEKDSKLAAQLLLQAEQLSGHEPAGAMNAAVAVLRQPHPLILRGHTGRVARVAFSHTGRQLLTASADRTVRLWSSEGKGPSTVLTRHEAWISEVRYSSDGKYVLTAASDGSVHLFRNVGELVSFGEARDPAGFIVAAVWSPDNRHFATANQSGIARVWDLQDLSTQVELRGHKGPLVSIAFSPSGDRVATASTDKTARVFASDGKGKPIVLRGHTARVNDVAFSPDGKAVVTASDDGTARVWTLASRAETALLRGHVGAVTSATYSADGQQIVTTSADGTARLWTVGQTSIPIVFAGHRGLVVRAEFSPDGTRLLTASRDGTARVWTLSGGDPPLVLSGHSEPLTSAIWSADGKRVATTSEDTTCAVWQLGEPIILRSAMGFVASAHFDKTGERVVIAGREHAARVFAVGGSSEPLALLSHNDRLTGAVFSPDGKYILTAAADWTAKVWSAAQLDQAAPIVLGEHPGTVLVAAFSADGKLVVTGAVDGSARIWRRDGKGVPIVLSGHEGAVTSASFSSDGQWVVTSSRDHTARVWPVDGKGEAVVLRGHEAAVNRAVFSPDGRSVATAADDRTGRLWPADGKQVPLVLGGHDERVLDIAWSPDGQSLVTAAADGLAKVYSAKGRELVTLRGHERTVLHAAFNPTGDRIVTASADHTARVWLASEGTELLTLRGHIGDVTSVEFSADGGRIVTASLDGTARIWRVGWASLREYLRALAGDDCLSVHQREQLLGEPQKSAQTAYDACLRAQDK